MAQRVWNTRLEKDNSNVSQDGYTAIAFRKEESKEILDKLDKQITSSADEEKRLIGVNYVKKEVYADIGNVQNAFPNDKIILSKKVEKFLNDHKSWQEKIKEQNSINIKTTDVDANGLIENLQSMRDEKIIGTNASYKALEVILKFQASEKGNKEYTQVTKKDIARLSGLKDLSMKNVIEKTETAISMSDNRVTNILSDIESTKASALESIKNHDERTFAEAISHHLKGKEVRTTFVDNAANSATDIQENINSSVRKTLEQHQNLEKLLKPFEEVRSKQMQQG